MINLRKIQNHKFGIFAPRINFLFYSSEQLLSVILPLWDDWRLSGSVSPRREYHIHLELPLTPSVHPLFQDTFPETLEPASNSIVCTKKSGILTELFNQTTGDERQLQFPPRRCRHANIKCRTCLYTQECSQLGKMVKLSEKKTEILFSL